MDYFKLYIIFEKNDDTTLNKTLFHIYFCFKTFLNCQDWFLSFLTSSLYKHFSNRSRLWLGQGVALTLVESSIGLCCDLLRPWHIPCALLCLILSLETSQSREMLPPDWRLGRSRLKARVMRRHIMQRKTVTDLVMLLTMIRKVKVT